MKKHEQIINHLGKREGKIWKAHTRKLISPLSVKIFNYFWVKLDKPLKASGTFIVEDQIRLFRGMDYEE